MNSDLLVVAILVGVFVFAIWLVRVLGRMIDRDTDPAGFEDDAPDTAGSGRPA